jgi:hypothetical protein
MRRTGVGLPGRNAPFPIEPVSGVRVAPRPVRWNRASLRETGLDTSLPSAERDAVGQAARQEVARMPDVAPSFFFAADVSDYMPSKFEFYELCHVLVWAVWAVLNFWIWKKTKALGNLLMLIGAGAAAVIWFLALFSYGLEIWLLFLALVTVTHGFFFSVKPLVEAHLAALKTKMQNLTAKKEGGGTPPPPAKP